MNYRNNLICFMLLSSPLLFLNSISLAQVSVQPNKNTVKSQKVDVPSRCLQIMKHPTSSPPNTLNNNNKAVQPPIGQFTASTTKWKLKSIDVDIDLLQHNRAQYQNLLQAVKSDLTGSIAYYESNDYALLTLISGQFYPIYYGKIQKSSNDIILSHYVENCPSCAKNVSYSRVFKPDQTLSFRLQDEDEDKSDVFYVLTFEK